MSKMFDPKKKYSDSDEGVPPGEYLIAMRSFQRKVGKESGKPYLRARYEVIAGPAKGSSFFATLSIDIDNAGSMTRLSLMAECCGCEEAFDLDSDREIAVNLCDRPFKARISRKTANGYTNNEIERYVKEPTSAEIKTMNAWTLDNDEDAQVRGRSSGSSSNGRGGSNRAADDFADDDIPF